VVVDPDNKPSLNFGLAAVVYEWARGVSFRDITQVGAY
jgi:superfamily II RNA helicase